MAGESKNVTLVGAGLVGSLLSIFLARRGYSVEIFERREDMRRAKISAGRSINLAVSVRGIQALKQLGLEQEILKNAVAMKGRMMHSPTGDLTFQAYGTDDSQCIYSVSRGELNKVLLTMAETHGKARIHFARKLESVDLVSQCLTFKNESNGASDVCHYSTVIGTDGSASMLRSALGDVEGFELSEEVLDYSYKELAILPGPGGASRMDRNALHIWPRGNFMLIALPNFDGSFTCTLFLKTRGVQSFEDLQSPAKVKDFLMANFADACPMLERPEEMFFENPTGHMVTVRCAPWSLGKSVLLLGDAAHAIVPFFGQGMNSGFEDCTLLDGLLETQTLGRAIERFGKLRKPDADAIAQMAVENFVEMRDKVADPAFLMEKSVEKILAKAFPGVFVGRYGLVTFSRVPYSQALAAGLVQDRILRELCQGLARPEDVNLDRARALIQSELTTLFSFLHPN